MSYYRKSLKRSILAATTAFILLLCVVLSAVEFWSCRKMLFDRYEVQIGSILRYVAADIDGDDLKRCIETGVTSEKYDALQVELDRMRARLDIHFIYVIIPVNTEPVDNIINVIAGVSEYERTYLADKLVYLNMPAGDSYPPEVAAKYLNAYQSGKLSFFVEKSEWGEDYTGLLPIFDSEGNKVAALCVDVDIAEIHTVLRSNILTSVVMIVSTGLLFIALFALWADRNVTTPIEKLESSVVDFASKCRDQSNPETLTIDVSSIHTKNEVETLAHAVSEMSEAIRDYMKSIQYTENELARMIVLANKDALTEVRNSNAFKAYKIEMNAKLRGGELRFAALMADVNDLKKINDTYGHEKGDLYIRKSCRMICDVFVHSPVFRIGGDEFAVILTGRDYGDRAALVEELRRQIDATVRDETAQPWERCSVAVGTADFLPGTDAAVEDVLRRADQAMYREKEIQKQTR